MGNFKVEMTVDQRYVWLGTAEFFFLLVYEIFLRIFDFFRRLDLGCIDASDSESRLIFHSFNLQDDSLPESVDFCKVSHTFCIIKRCN